MTEKPSQKKMELKILNKILTPYSLIDEIAERIWPIAEEYLRGNYQRFRIGEKVFNLFAIVVLHSCFMTWSWWSFYLLVIFLGVCKRICQKYRAEVQKLAEARIPTKTAEKSKNKRRGREFFDFGKKDRVIFDADRVEEFCKGNLKPSLDWLNLVVKTVHLNFRAFAKFKVLHEIWPKVKVKLENTPLKTLEIYDFNIGDKPFRILSIECIDYSTKHLIIDAEVAYDGNANVSITFSQKSLNISVPVTLQKFSVSNVKVRIVLKNLKSVLPLVEGVQFFFLESPVIDWETSDAGKVVSLPELDSFIKHMIDQQIIKRLVLPNRLSIPVQLPDELKKTLTSAGFTVEDPSAASVVMPDPEAIIRVTVVKAQNLRPTDLGFAHYAKSENLNPCKPSQFACSELLPKKSSGDPYVVVSIGKESYKSATVLKNLSPVWNFTCEFVIEYYHKALIKLELYDSDYALGGIISDDLLGRITEKISRIREKKIIEGWYNCQIYQGRAHLKFEWIPLKLVNPYIDQTIGKSLEIPGALCLYLGELHAKTPLRPTVAFDIVNSSGTIKQKKSLDAVSYDKDLVFNEGKIFRLKNVMDNELELVLKVYDNKCEEFVGQRQFKIKSLMEERLDDFYKIPNIFNNNPEYEDLVLSLRSKICYDGDHALEGLSRATTTKEST